jgi:hypothetical protein
VTGRGKRRNRRRSFKVVKSQRETLERELLWNVALDGDPARREQIRRMLSSAANDPSSVMSPPESSLLQGQHEDRE